jgi:hypothetical protein
MDHTNALDNWLQASDYTTLLTELEKSDDPTDRLMVAISHYKLDQFAAAEAVLEVLYADHPTIEIGGYLVITKIKLSNPMGALSAYQTLCNHQTPALLAAARTNDTETLTSICLTLLAIPVERPKCDPGATIEDDISNANYSAVIKKLETI